jgi:hypothetical protein
MMEKTCKCNVLKFLNPTPIRESECYYQIDAFPLHYCFYCGGRVCQQYSGLKVWFETFLTKRKMKKANCIEDLIRVFGKPKKGSNTLPQKDTTFTTADLEKIKSIVSEEGLKSDRLVTFYYWESKFRYIYLSVSAYAKSGKIESFSITPRYVKLVKLSCPKFDPTIKDIPK